MKVFGARACMYVGAKQGDASQFFASELMGKYFSRYHCILEGVSQGECLDSDHIVIAVAVLSMTGHMRSWKIGLAGRVAKAALRERIAARLPPLWVTLVFVAKYF